MNKKQELFWNLLCNNYPSKKTCRNCKYWKISIKGFPCIDCHELKDDAWEWNPGAPETPYD